MYVHIYTYIISQSKTAKSPHDLRNMHVAPQYKPQLSQGQTQILQKIIVSSKDNKTDFIEAFHSMKKFSVSRIILDLMC